MSMIGHTVLLVRERELTEPGTSDLFDEIAAPNPARVLLPFSYT
jgi:hypothetical protein